jgi:hypothetical protein
MAIATLSIDLIAKLADLEAGFNRAAQLADKSANKIEMSFAGLTNKAVELGKAIGGIWAAKQAIGFIDDVNEGTAALEDLSTATGSTVENLSALEDVGRRTGNSFETVAATLVKFNKGLEGAKAGDDVSRIFDALGLSVKELKALDPAEALRRTAVALEGWANEGDKARAVQVLFGKSIREAAPFLRDLADQTKLVGTVTADAAKAAKQFDDSLHTLSKELLDASRAIIGPLVDGLNVLIAKFLEARDASRAWAKEGREKDAAESRANDLRLVNDMIAANTKRLDEGNLSIERRNRLLNQQKGLFAQQANLQAGMDAGASPFAALSGVVTTPSKPSLKVKDAATAESEIQKLIGKYRELFEAELRVNDIDRELEKAKAMLADPKFANATEAEKQIVRDYADGLDKLRAAFAQASDEKTKFRLNEIRDIEKTNEALRQAKLAQVEEGSALFRAGAGDASTATIEKEIRLREYLKSIGQEGSDQGAASINALYDTLDPTIQKMSELDIAVQDLGKSLDDTLGQGLEAMLTGHFDSIGKLFQRMLEQMAVKALQANLMDAMFGAMGTGGQRSGGGWVSAIMGAVGYGTRASGGLVAPFSLTQVNDQAGASGVEGFSSNGKDFLLTGSRGGRVTQAGGSANAVVQVNIAAGVSRNEVAALIPALKSQIKAEVIASMRRPGFSGG